MSNHTLHQNNYLPVDTLINDGQYRIRKVIGHGGFGITYLADELGYFELTGFGKDFIPHTNGKVQQVVVKELYFRDHSYRDSATLRLEITGQEKQAEFQRMVRKQLEEGKILRQIRHPHIIRTRNIFEENGTAYMVTDYVESDDLAHVLDGKGTGTPDTAACKMFMAQVMDAVQFIHTMPEPILHLDISPGNILLEKTMVNGAWQYRRAVLIDFGAAYLYNTAGDLLYRTSLRITGFKHGYAPMEQLAENSLSRFEASFDTYAIGATLYHLLSKKQPRPSSENTSDKFNWPSRQNPGGGISEFLDYFLFKAINRNYEFRFHTAEKMWWCFQREQEFNEKLAEAGKMLQLGIPAAAIELLKELHLNFFSTKTSEKLMAECVAAEQQQKNKERFEYHLKNGKELMQAGNYEKALTELNLAGELYTTDELQELIAVCKKIIDEGSLLFRVTKLVEEIRAAVKVYDFEKARKLWQQLQELQPDSHHLPVLEADIHEAEKKYAAEKQEAAKVIAKGNDHYTDEAYQAAKDCYEIIPLHFTGLLPAVQAGLLTKENITAYTSLQNRIEALAERLGSTLPYNQPALIRQIIKSATAENEACKKELEGLKLPAVKLKQGIGENEESITDIKQYAGNTEEGKGWWRDKKKMVKVIAYVLTAGLIIYVIIALVNDRKRGDGNMVNLPPVNEEKNDTTEQVNNLIDTTNKVKMGAEDTLFNKLQPDTAGNTNWKREFENKFKLIYYNETSLGSAVPNKILNDYRKLLQQLPANAVAERDRVNRRIKAILKSIADNELAGNDFYKKNKADAERLVREANNLMELNYLSWDKAYRNYVRANELIEGAGNPGITKFMEKYQEGKNSGAPAEEINKYLEYANTIKRTRPVFHY